MRESLTSNPAGWRRAILIGPALVLFFLMLVVPTAYRPLKVVLIVAVLAAIAASVYRSPGRPRLDPAVIAWVAAYVLAGAFFVVLGRLHQAPGALRESTVYIFWPVLFTIFVAGASDLGILRSLERVFLPALLAITLYSLAFIVLTGNFINPASFLPDLHQQARVVFYKGYVQFNVNSLATVLFVVPYLVATLMVGVTSTDAPDDAAEAPLWGRSWLRRVAIGTALCLGLLLTVLSLRRSLVVVAALSPFLTIALLFLLPVRVDRRGWIRLFQLTVGLGVLIVVLTVISHFEFGVAPGTLSGKVAQGFDVTSTDPGPSTRVDQFHYLIAGWEKGPLFGSGYGAIVPGFQPRPDVVQGIRLGVTQPWSYELSYVALLYHTGLFGLGLYAAGVLWIFWSGLRIIRSGHPLARRVIPVLVGTASFLIANATNPYLEKYDYMWVIFLPLAYVNLWLLAERPLGPAWSRRLMARLRAQRRLAATITISSPIPGLDKSAKRSPN
jgi:hypothetical protein